MESWNNRTFLLTLATLPLACGPGIVANGPDDSGSTSTDGPTSGPPDTATGGTSSTGGTSATGENSSSAEASSSLGTSSASTGAEDGSTETSGGSSSGGEESSSSSTGSPELCETWAEGFEECYPDYYDPAYLLELCGYYSQNEVCPVEAIEVLECEAALGVCGANCQSETSALNSCEDAAEAEALGCAELPVIEPAGTIEAACSSVAAQALTCDAMDYYVSGFSQYADYMDAQEVLQDFCTSGAYWVFSPKLDPLSSCGGAFEELLACVQTLDCQEFDDAATAFPGGPCAEELVAIECKCELGVN